jgi:hypothetical protein
MTSVFSPVRVAACALALCLSISSFGHALAAHQPLGIHGTITRSFSGRIASLVLGLDGNPSSFILQLPNLNTFDFKVVPATVSKPNSAEAEIEGLQRNDYALVRARGRLGSWTAVKVTYDVRPLDQVMLNGTVLKVSRNGRRFELTLTDSGKSRWVVMNLKTRFRINGQAANGMPIVVKGDLVQVLARQVKQVGFVALLVNLKTAALRL